MTPFFFKSYSKHFDMGHLPDFKDKNDCGAKIEDFENMSRRGLYFIEGAALSLAKRDCNTAPLQFAGYQMGACYLNAWDIKLQQRFSR